MMKKLARLTAAVAVLAFAVPASAFALETGLTETAGTLVPVGTKVEFTGIGNVVITSSKLGNITCISMTLTGEAKSDSLSEVLIQEGTENHNFATGCSVPSKAEVIGEEINFNEFKTTGEVVEGTNTKGKFHATFVIKVGHAVCHFTTSTAVGTYVSGTDVIKVSEGALTVSPGAACGTTAKLDGSFTLTTDVSPFTPINIM